MFSDETLSMPSLTQSTLLKHSAELAERTLSADGVDDMAYDYRQQQCRRVTGRYVLHMIRLRCASCGRVNVLARTRAHRHTQVIHAHR